MNRLTLEQFKKKSVGFLVPFFLFLGSTGLNYILDDLQNWNVDPGTRAIISMAIAQIIKLYFPISLAKNKNKNPGKHTNQKKNT